MEEEKQETPQLQGKKSMKTILAGGLILAVLVLGGGALILNGKRAVRTAPEPPAVEGSQTESSPNPADTEIKIINVEAGSYFFKPNEIKIKKGQAVKIVMSVGDMMHDFNVDELGIKIPITKAGSTGSVEFVAERTGTFEYYCSVANHRKQGQVGKFIVEP